MAGLTTLTDLPNEVFVKIVECCDTRAFLNLQMVNKSTKQLLTVFEKQIATAISEQEFHYEDTIAYNAPFPAGIDLLKRLHRRELVHEICGAFATLGSRWQPPTSPPMPPPETNRSQDGDYTQFYRCIENGCAVSWALCEIFKGTKKALEEAGTRKAALDQLLHHKVKIKSLALIKSLTNFEAFCFQLFYFLRASEHMDWTPYHVGTAVLNGTLVMGPYYRKSISKELVDAAEWSHWYSLMVVSPCSTILFLKKTKELRATSTGNTDFYKQSSEDLLNVAPIYASISAPSRTAQGVLAKQLLAALDKQSSGLPPTVLLSNGYRTMVANCLWHASKRTLVEMSCMCLPS